jgi:hypothetical protein
MADVVWDTPAVTAQTRAVNARRASNFRSAVRAAAVVCVPVCLVFAGSSAAFASPVGIQFVPLTSPVVWPATEADGTAHGSTVTVDTAEVALGSQLPGGVPLISNQRYFYVALHPSYLYAGDPNAPFAMPITAATLVTTHGTITGIPVPPSSLAIDGSWYFPVNGTVSSVTLNVASFTKVLGNERGDFNQWTFSPAPIDFVAQHVAGSTSPGVGQAGAGKSQTGTPVATTAPQGGVKGDSTPVGVLIGAGAAGALVLGAAAAGLVSVVRRRTFTRADREGRIVFSGPPVLAAGAALAGAAVPRERHGIVVKLLGPLQVDGTKRPVTAGPLLELIVFLALNPGETFTSVQLQERIWGLGRKPIASQTLRKYMVELRKAFGTGVVVTDVYRYELTEAVISDWALCQAFLVSGVAADDVLSGQEDALALVRGPVLHGSFDGKKNSPFSWAVGTVNDIEDNLTTVAAELALACLDIDDPKRAKQAVGQGLLCSEANLQLRLVDLRVGAALGGPKELGRRLEAGRAAMATFPQDVAVLERAARSLGWIAAEAD